jgi:hypothetical protein
VVERARSNDAVAELVFTEVLRGGIAFLLVAEVALRVEDDGGTLEDGALVVVIVDLEVGRSIGGAGEGTEDEGGTVTGDGLAIVLGEVGLGLEATTALSVVGRLDAVVGARVGGAAASPMSSSPASS